MYENKNKTKNKISVLVYVKNVENWTEEKNISTNTQNITLISVYQNDHEKSLFHCRKQLGETRFRCMCNGKFSLMRCIGYFYTGFLGWAGRNCVCKLWWFKPKNMVKISNLLFLWEFPRIKWGSSNNWTFSGNRYPYYFLIPNLRRSEIIKVFKAQNVESVILFLGFGIG